MTQSEDTKAVDNANVDAFIAKWQGVVASELSTSQSFLIDLCALLGVHPSRSTVVKVKPVSAPILVASTPHLQ